MVRPLVRILLLRLSSGRPWRRAIKALICPARPIRSKILSKQAMRLTRPPMGVMGFAVEASRTYRAEKTVEDGVTRLVNRLVKRCGVRLFGTTQLPYHP